MEYQRVTQTFVRRAEALVAVTIEGEGGAPLVTTEEHPFYIHRARDSLGGDEDGEGSWVAAGALRAGDYVRRPAGESARVLKVEARPEQATVYNFEVENNHNYFVGALGVLVHNSCSTRLREQVLGNNPDCVWCKLPAARNGKPGQVDRWPLEGAHGGRYTPDNAVPSCAHCNPSRGTRDRPVNPPSDYPVGAPWPPPNIPTRP